MSAVTLEQLKEVLDEKLRPLREEVSNLRTKLNDATAFLNLANQKYEEILKQHKKHEQDHNDICAEKSKTHPKIIAKFVRRDVREKFYRARTKLKTFTTKDLDYSMENPIYINESLTEKNKELFRDCLKAKKDLNYSFIWTNYGKIYMRKSASSESIHIKDKLTLQKISV